MADRTLTRKFSHAGFNNKPDPEQEKAILLRNKAYKEVATVIQATFNNKATPHVEACNDLVKKVLETCQLEVFLVVLEKIVLAKGSVVLRDPLLKADGQPFVDGLVDQWRFFFHKALPSIEALLCPILTHNHEDQPAVDIRMLALQVYRRVVICSPKMQAKILSTVPRHLNGTSAKSLENMLLILQGVPGSEESIESGDKKASESCLEILKKMIDMIGLPYLPFSNAVIRKESKLEKLRHSSMPAGVSRPPSDRLGKNIAL